MQPWTGWGWWNTIVISTCCLALESTVPTNRTYGDWIKINQFFRVSADMFNQGSVKIACIKITRSGAHKLYISPSEYSPEESGSVLIDWDIRFEEVLQWKWVFPCLLKLWKDMSFKIERVDLNSHIFSSQNVMWPPSLNTKIAKKHDKIIFCDAHVLLRAYFVTIMFLWRSCFLTVIFCDHHVLWRSCFLAIIIYSRYFLCIIVIKHDRHFVV